jgi:glyoxylase-like metal-dependent hydrolase (beta-lactamase superfamily II)
VVARRVADGVFQVPTDYPATNDVPLWLYVLRSRAGSGSATLIDTATPTTFDAGVGSALREIGIDPADVGDVVLTHGHPDHQGGASTWLAVSGARISAPLDDVPWIEDPERQWRELWDGYPGAISLVDARDGLMDMCGGPVRVDRPLRDGDLVDLGDRALEVIQTRGHTRGHVALLDRATGCLFSGDVVQGRGMRTSSGTSAIAPMYEDVVDYRAGLERLLATPFELLCPAHREPLPTAEGQELIRESLAFVDEIDVLVRELVDATAGPLSSRHVAERIGGRVGCTPPATMQATTVALAHLTELARTGAIDEAWTHRAPGTARQD